MMVCVASSCLLLFSSHMPKLCVCVGCDASKMMATYSFAYGQLSHRMGSWLTINQQMKNELIPFRHWLTAPPFSATKTKRNMNHRRSTNGRTLIHKVARVYRNSFYLVVPLFSHLICIKQQIFVCCSRKKIKLSFDSWPYVILFGACGSRALFWLPLHILCLNLERLSFVWNFAWKFVMCVYVKRASVLPGQNVFFCSSFLLRRDSFNLHFKYRPNEQLNATQMHTRQVLLLCCPLFPHLVNALPRNLSFAYNRYSDAGVNFSS